MDEAQRARMRVGIIWAGVNFPEEWCLKLIEDAIRSSGPPPHQGGSVAEDPERSENMANMGGLDATAMGLGGVAGSAPQDTGAGGDMGGHMGGYMGGVDGGVNAFTPPSTPPI